MILIKGKLLRQNLRYFSLNKNTFCEFNIGEQVMMTNVNIKSR